MGRNRKALESARVELDADVLAYYDRFPEESRLERGPFQLERARTRELIGRHAPRPPADVADVGGGAGAYAFWLAELGYRVHLVDATPRLVGEATRRNADASHRLVSCSVGDARRLRLDDESVDLLLLLGPLYHLTEAADRSQSLRETARALREGGVLIAGAISRYASTLDGMTRGLFQDPRFQAIVERDLNDGQHRNDTERADYFTTSYFHKPDELRGEVEAAGFIVDAVYGVEGPGWLLPDFEERWADPILRGDLERGARLLESEPSVLGASAHLLAVGHRTHAP